VAACAAETLEAVSLGSASRGVNAITKEASEFVARYIDAWNRQDAEAVASHLSESGVYLDIVQSSQMTRDQLVEHLEEVFALEPYRYELVGEVCAGASTIAFQYRAQPREQQGSSAAGAAIDTWLGAEFITLGAGRASEIADYYEQRGQASPQSPLADMAGPGRVLRYAKSGLSAAQLDSLKQQLETLMAERSVYLRPDLTLPELAKQLDCSVNHLSQVINAGCGMSFFDYVNRHRIDAAVDLLSNDVDESLTVLDVALEVGFNSTSTFYAAFKKVTGKTPAQFRRALTD
jgi:AraC-like DNA-binding protein